MQKVVLNDVADRSDLVIELPAAGDAEFLRKRDLDAVHVVAVPNRLEKRVGKPKVEQVLHRLLAKIMINAEYRVFLKNLVQRDIQRPRGREVATERLFNDDTRILCASRAAQAFNDGRKHARRDREIVQRPLAALERDTHPLESIGISIVAIDVAQRADKLAGDLFFDAFDGADGVPRMRLEIIKRPTGLGYPHERDIKLAPSTHRIERRQDLLVREVAARAEQNQCVRSWCLCHSDFPEI